MKQLFILLTATLLFSSCKETPKEIITESKMLLTEVEVDESKYPDALRKIFNAHGGLTTWKSKRMISFEIPKSDNSEKHTIDLRSRNERIEMPLISMGSYGSDIWLLDEKETYKGDAIFYHNLMFYFYTMPFVLADDGINYADAEILKFEGNSFPGIRITYDDGVGNSAKDEYFIHYNPETFQMEWLGYTVTYRSGEKSDNVRWIRYNDLMNVEGVLLPKSLTWYDYEGRIIKEAREPLNFENVTLSESDVSADFFAKPEGAKIIITKKD